MTVGELEKILAGIQDKDATVVVYDQVMEHHRGRIIEPTSTDLFDGCYRGGGLFCLIPGYGEPQRILLIH